MKNNVEVYINIINLLLKPVSEIFPDAPNIIKKLKEDVSNIYFLLDKLADEYAWIFSLDMKESFALDILERIEHESTQEEIDKIFIEYFYGNNYYEMLKLLQKWEKTGKHRERLEILKDCIYSIVMCEKWGDEKRLNIENVVVPTLITQIDGILIEYYYNRSVEPAAKKRLTKTDKMNLLEDTRINNIIKVKKILENKLFVIDSKVINDHKIFYRNGIIHGETLNYGTKANVVRLIVILDALFSIT